MYTCTHDTNAHTRVHVHTHNTSHTRITHSHSLPRGRRAVLRQGRGSHEAEWVVSEAGPSALPEQCVQEKLSCCQWGATCPLSSPLVCLRRSPAGQSVSCPPAFNTGLLGPNSQGLGLRGLTSKAGGLPRPAVTCRQPPGGPDRPSRGSFPLRAQHSFPPRCCLPLRRGH